MAEINITVTAAVSEATGALNEVSASMQSVEQRAAALNKANFSVAASTKNATSEMSNMGSALAITSASQERMSSTATAASESMIGVEIAAARMNRPIFDSLQMLRTMATYTAPFAIAGAFIKAEKSAIEFNDALNYVGTLVHGNRALMGQWEDQIHQMAPRLGQTTTDLAKGLYEVLSANVAPGDAMKVLEISSKAATAGHADTFNTVKLLTSAMHSYGMAVSDLPHISDIFFTGARLGMTQLPELAQSIGPALPWAAKLHISLEQVTAGLVTLTEAGYDTAESSTALKDTFAELYKSAHKFREAGIDIISDAQSGGLPKVLEDIKKLTHGDGEAMQKLMPNIRGLGLLLTLTGKNAANFSENLEEMQNSAGETGRAYETVMSGSSGALKRLKGAISDLEDQFGKTVDATPLLNALTSITEKATSSLSVIQKLTSAITTFEGLKGAVKGLIHDPLKTHMAGFSDRAKWAARTEMRLFFPGLRYAESFFGNPMTKTFDELTHPYVGYSPKPLPENGTGPYSDFARYVNSQAERPSYPLNADFAKHPDSQSERPLIVNIQIDKGGRVTKTETNNMRTTINMPRGKF